MRWRPWVVGGAVIAAGVSNLALLWDEEIRVPEKQSETTVATGDRLADRPVTAGARLGNFKAYGLPDDMAQLANERGNGLLRERGDRFRTVLKDNAQVGTRIFCANSDGVPPRYSALGVLVVDDGSSRRVVAPEDLTAIELQEWFAGSPVKDVFKKLELDPERKEDATVMGVAAVLLGEESTAVQRQSPWGSGWTSPWSLGRVLDEYADNKIRNKLIEYFSLSHVLTELANEDGGICR